MITSRFPYRRSFLIAACTLLIAGCEGIDRKHDTRVGEITPPPVDTDSTVNAAAPQLANFPDLVETMLAKREKLAAVRDDYIAQLIELERAYLNAGDATKANWARRQRERIETVNLDPYPYLTAAPPEHRDMVAPEQSIPEADTLYNEGVAILESFNQVPFAGFLESNQQKARQALEIFKRILREYPLSDKVDDAAFFCGDIYKEYLREDDPNNELAVRYYQWAFALDPETPHPARFNAAVVYDFRRHERARALELYHQVLETEEAGNDSNMRFSATRIDQLTDEEGSPIRPKPPTGSVATSGDRE